MKKRDKNNSTQSKKNLIKINNLVVQLKPSFLFNF